MKKLLLGLAFCSGFTLNAQLLQHTETPYVPGEVLVQVKPGYSIDNLLKAFPASVDAKNKGLLADEMGIYLLGFNHHAVTHSDFIQKLYMLNEVQAAQNNHYIDDVRATPNDANFTGQQWHHRNTGQTGGTNDADIDSELAWDITTGGLTNDGDTIVICLVEGGGANWTHPDLITNFWHNYDEIPNNGIDDDGNGYTDDFDGWRISTNSDNHNTGNHGTECMGMMGARGNNAIGVAGANWNVKVMLVSGFTVSSESSVISAYNYPLKMRKRYNSSNGAIGAFVVATSSSWGIDNANPNSYPLWCNFYDSLGIHGILSPCATTNSSVNIDVAGDMPTACDSPYMISVTRTGQTDNQAGGYGVVNVDLGAPGINVSTTSGTNGYTTFATGTSYATPLTAGVIALMYSVPCPTFMNVVKNNPQAGADSVLKALYAGVETKASLASITATGGRLNANNSVHYIYDNCFNSVPEESVRQPYAHSLYPNPAGDMIIIDLLNNSRVQGKQHSLEIFNALGELVNTVVLTTQQTQVNTVNLQDGVYIYRISFSDGFMANGRFIVAR